MDKIFPTFIVNIYYYFSKDFNFDKIQFIDILQGLARNILQYNHYLPKYLSTRHFSTISPTIPFWLQIFRIKQIISQSKFSITEWCPQRIPCLGDPAIHPPGDKDFERFSSNLQLSAPVILTEECVHRLLRGLRVAHTNTTCCTDNSLLVHKSPL